MIREMAIITYSYPTKDDPIYAFIRPVACGLSELGIRVSVISPQSVTNALKRKVAIRPRHWTDHSDSGKPIEIYQPAYISLSRAKIRGQLVTYWLYEKAVKKAFRRLPVRPDLLYAHFWESAVAGAFAMGGEKIPLIAVSGENRITVRENYTESAVEDAVKKVSGLICVSTKNLNECSGQKLITDSMKTVVLPNAVNAAVFRKTDRAAARRAIGWPQDAVIAIFVGELTHRKGVNRVIEAAKGVPNVKLVLVGEPLTGEAVLPSEQILHIGKLPHAEIAAYLNAADFFVLPTLSEGCCNAIVEALACGLPVISSALPFNDDILNDENSLRVNPEDIDAIRDAMKKLADSAELRARLALGAEKTGAQLSIEKRAEKIAAFLEECCS